MTLSNEPGYYEDGSFGVRHENVLVVTAAAALENCAVHSEYLSFESLTVAPFQVRAPPPPHEHTHGTEWHTSAHALTPAPTPVGFCSRTRPHARGSNPELRWSAFREQCAAPQTNKQANKPADAADQDDRAGAPLAG
jgi:hypothetical protein